ncbi:MAG: hypothetical protein Ct9H300mP23_03890 [Nitrospinota bacterium]|nr:MAG: hypothetical protein Ct9H300mP23_03890 [Nitrospinota bacterium]
MKLNQFGPLLEEIIRIRSGDEWNLPKSLGKKPMPPRGPFKFKGIIERYDFSSGGIVRK